MTKCAVAENIQEAHTLPGAFYAAWPGFILK